MGWLLWWLACVLTCVCSALLLVRSFAHPSLERPVLFTVFVSWSLAFSMVFLVPLDLVHTPSMRADLMSGWTSIYWISFVLTWFAIPIQQSYFDSGHFTMRSRMREAIRFNLRFYISAGVLLALLVVFVAVRKGVELGDILGLSMAMANAWGFLLMVLLLGYGLVEIPRQLWFAANQDRRLRFYYFKAVSVYNDRESAIDKLSESTTLTQSCRQRVGVAPFMESFLSEIEGKCPLAGSFPISASFPKSSLWSDLQNRVPDEELLARLHYRVKKDVHEMRRVQYEWSKLCRRIQALEAADSGVDSESDELTTLLRWPSKAVGSALVVRALSCICIGLSSIVIWCELTLGIGVELSVFHHLIEGAQGHPVLVEFFALLLMLYLSICTFFSMFSLRLASYYHLHSSGHSEANSLLFNASYLLRLVFPLGVNFMSIVSTHTDRAHSAFLSVVGPMSAVPLLGTTFNTYLPIVIGGLSLATFFNVYGRVLRTLHISRFDDDSEASDDILFEGRTLIRQEQRRRARLNSHQARAAGAVGDGGYEPLV